jgi:hypothetical protein
MTEREYRRARQIGALLLIVPGLRLMVWSVAPPFSQGLGSPLSVVAIWRLLTGGL